MNIEIKQINDIDRLMMWRKEVVRSVFNEDPDDALIARSHSYYRRRMADGSHFSIIVKVDGKEAGCGGICFSEELPSPDNPNGMCGYFMNIYVRPEFRRQGIGGKIVDCLIEESRRRDCGKIYLETTDLGKEMYRSRGFKGMTGMMQLT